MPFLSQGYWVDNQNHLREILEKLSDKALFFIHLEGQRTELDSWVLDIKKHSAESKILYVLEDFKKIDLRTHQASATGGDAYVDFNIVSNHLAEILQGFGEDMVDKNAANQKQTQNLGHEFSKMDDILKVKKHPLSLEMDRLFKDMAKENTPQKAGQKSKETSQSGVDMSSLKSGDLSLVGFDLPDVEEAPAEIPQDQGMELDLGSDDLSLSLDEGYSESENTESSDTDFEMAEEVIDEGEASSEDFGVDLGDEVSIDSDEQPLENLGDISFPDTPAMNLDDEISLSDDVPEISSLSLSDDVSLGDDAGLDFGSGDVALDDSNDLSEDAKSKLREIDAIMEATSSQILVNPDFNLSDDDDLMDSSLDKPLVSEDLNLDSLNFTNEEAEVVEEEEKPKRKKKEVKEAREPREASVQDRQTGQDFKEISGAYNGEMERTQATISNLRADREELLLKIQQLEESHVLHNRQTLTLRAELDEKKIELTIMRRKLNEEIGELKDRFKLQEERKLILEEKNKILTQELDKAGQRNKMDVKKVQMRERELEQKLELLKSDAETQIRHRDLKILELKRKLDAMEFDMESISTQEKRSVESRFELEDKLDKAIKTLRNAITVLEDESDRGSVMEALKKNIDI